MFPPFSRLPYRVAAPFDCPETLRRTKLKLFNPRFFRIALTALAGMALMNLIGTGRTFAKGAATSTDGAAPWAGLVECGGNFYGTTSMGGANTKPSAQGDGTVFKVTPTGTETVLFSFNSSSGYRPESSLIADPTTCALYGTTLSGGASNDGTVFELSPPTKMGGAWTDSTLVSFNGTNGAAPHGGLTTDGTNLYGTTQAGGAWSSGTVFELIKSGGTWTPSVLHSFNGNDGAKPLYTSLILSGGNLYGTTTTGGSYGFGTVFELIPSSSSPGTWSETTLYSFAGYNSDGAAPVGLFLNPFDGNLYGETRYGGSGASGDNSNPPDGAGTVFKVTPAGSGSVLWDFNGGSDGDLPYAGVIADSAGNLYGTTQSGGTGYGTVFELNKAGAYSVLHRFAGGTSDGAEPAASLTNYAGILYGTTMQGGSSGAGTVFKINPDGTGYAVLYNFK
jgi:uncharacterized repeat protein (TIGR03803 family)